MKEDKILVILVIDPVKTEWKKVWDEAGIYVAKIKESSYDKLTESIDKIQEEETI